MKFPNQDEVEKLGYSLYCFGVDKSAVFYCKGKLCLKVYNSKEAELSSSYKMIQLTTGKISFPNKNFHIFENQMLRLLQGVE